jgi:hypothetical protein
MQGRNIVKLAALALSALPILAGAQAPEVTHISSRGYVQNTYWSAPGASAFFQVAQASVLNGGQSTAATAYGHATIFTPGGLIVYVTNWTDTSANVLPSNAALRTPGWGAGSFSARKMEYQFGPFGIQLVGVTQGTIIAESTLANPTLVETSRQPYHNALTFPGLGLLFATNSTYHGKFAFNPTGTGGMVFVPESGNAETIVQSGTPVDPASWMGHFNSVETDVIRP